MRAAVVLCAILFASAALASNVNVLTPATFDSVVDGSVPALVEFYAPWCGHCKSLAPIWEELADAFAHAKSMVTIANVDADGHRDLGERFGVTGFPTILFFPKGYKKGDEPVKYQMGRSLDDLANFVTERTGARSKISKPESAVVVLTPETFDSVVLNADKDVLVEFYAPWCGHCKSLAPVYEKLAGVYRNEQGVVIANVDADAHRSLGERFGVSGFPTIKFFPKANKAGVDYDQGRALEDFVSYINAAAGTHRLADGSLDATAGRIDALDALAAKYSPSTAASLESQLKAALAAAASSPSQKFYAKSFEMVAKNGQEFVAKESARLTRLMSGDITALKKDELTIRKNVLAAFAQ